MEQAGLMHNLLYSEAQKHLLDINEYIGKLLDMEEGLKQNSEKK